MTASRRSFLSPRDDREPYAKRRDPECRRERQRRFRRRAGIPPRVPVPNYVVDAEREIASRLGIPRQAFGKAEHRAVTMLLVEWARAREPDGPLRTYDPRWRKYEGVGR